MNDKDVIRQGYDELAEVYAAKRSTDDREIAILETFLDSVPGSALILDAGCGQGTPILRRVSETTTTVGLDLSRSQLQIAADAVPSARLVQGDMTQLPFRSNAFDAITAYDSLIHVALNDHQTVLDEFARVLCSGGSLLLSEAPEERERTNPDWLDTGVEMRWSMAGAEATREQLRNAGFRVVNEWDAPKTPEDEPKPLFFLAKFDT